MGVFFYISRLRTIMWNFSSKIMPWMYTHIYGMEIGVGTTISRKACLDKATNPHGIHIGSYTRVTGNVEIMAHDGCRELKADTYIGNNCFIGTHAIILPGVHIGNECIVGAGSVVTKDVPDNTIVAGNPARVIRTGIHCKHYGHIIKDDAK